MLRKRPESLRINRESKFNNKEKEILILEFSFLNLKFQCQYSNKILRKINNQIEEIINNRTMFISIPMKTVKQAICPTPTLSILSISKVKTLLILNLFRTRTPPIPNKDQ